jgi:hypothetical protein
MLFIDRCDGKRIRRLPSFVAIMPYVVRGRNEAAVHFSKDVDVENAVRYVRPGVAGEVSDGQGGVEGVKPTIFGIVLAATVRTLALMPRLNRFVHRRGIYQRNDISISFLVKRASAEEGAEANAKIVFDPADTLSEAMERIEGGIRRAREGRPQADGLEMATLHGLPFGKALATSLFRILDRYNIAPTAMVASDPLFASAFFANLGSIGLDTPFHHLYEWGTASLFVVMGRMFQREVAKPDGSSTRRHFVNIKITADERIAEGIYYAHAVSLFQRFISHPELLERRPDLSEAET